MQIEVVPQSLVDSAVSAAVEALHKVYPIGPEDDQFAVEVANLFRKSVENTVKASIESTVQNNVTRFLNKLFRL